MCVVILSAARISANDQTLASCGWREVLRYAQDDREADLSLRRCRCVESGLSGTIFRGDLTPMEFRSLFHPAVAAWFESRFARRPRRRRGLAADQGRPAHADRGADRLGQDARRVPGGDRRSGAAGRRRRAAGRDAGRLCLAAEGAVQRHPAEPRSAARRHPRGAARRGSAGCRDPHLGAHRRHAGGRARPACAGGRRTSSSPRRSRSTSCSAPNRAATMLATTRTVIVDEIHARRAEQARQPSRAVAGAAERAVRRPAAAHRPVGDAEADRGGRALPGRRRPDGRRLRDRRHRPSARARSRARSSRLAARSGDVGRGLGAGLRPARGS